MNDTDLVKPSHTNTNTHVKRTRAERKAAQRAEFKHKEEMRELYQTKHPILSGVVKIVNYVPPK